MAVRDLFDLSGKSGPRDRDSRKLGKKLVLAFADQDAEVIGASRKMDSCKSVAAEVRSRFGRPASGR